MLLLGPCPCPYPWPGEPESSKGVAWCGGEEGAPGPGVEKGVMLMLIMLEAGSSRVFSVLMLLLSGAERQLGEWGALRGGGGGGGQVGEWRHRCGCGVCVGPKG